MEIIKIVNSEPTVSSGELAKGFGFNHEVYLKLIEKYKDRILRFGKLEESKEKVYIEKISPTSQVGEKKWKLSIRNAKVYLLNEQQAGFLITLSGNSENVLDFKEKLIKEFFKMKKVLNNLSNLKQTEEYKQARLEGKQVRKTFTDTIKVLEQYALQQNSEAKTKFLYSTYTKVLNNGLFDIEGKFKNIREVCNEKQLKKLELIEDELSIIILDEIKKETNYKDIYYIIKEKIIGFSNLFGKSSIIDVGIFLRPEKVFILY